MEVGREGDTDPGVSKRCCCQRSKHLGHIRRRSFVGVIVIIIPITNGHSYVRLVLSEVDIAMPFGRFDAAFKFNQCPMVGLSIAIDL